MYDFRIEGYSEELGSWVTLFIEEDSQEFTQDQLLELSRLDTKIPGFTSYKYISGLNSVVISY